MKFSAFLYAGLSPFFCTLAVCSHQVTFPTPSAESEIAETFSQPSEVLRNVTNPQQKEPIAGFHGDVLLDVGDPSSQPSSRPSTQPSSRPSSRPSVQPSSVPSTQPSKLPSAQPSEIPSAQPSNVPSSQPTSCPSSRPSVQPSSMPTAQPSTWPSANPSRAPSSLPTSQPSVCPSTLPSAQPSSVPSSGPSGLPSTQPTSRPSEQPSGVPSVQPTAAPSTQPSAQPTSQPSTPSSRPSGSPTCQPSALPSTQPTTEPSSEPTSQPSIVPSAQPSTQPSMQPSAKPSRKPSSQPSREPSAQPSTHPTRQPFSHPTSVPSGQPSRQPSGQPSSLPTSGPSCSFGWGRSDGRCEPCPKGYRSGERDQEVCEICPVGFYTTAERQTECLQCEYPSYTVDAGQHECSAFCACWTRRQTFTAFVFIGGIFAIGAVFGCGGDAYALLWLVLPVTNVFSDFVYLITETYVDTTLWASSLLCMVLPFSVFLARLCADGSWSALSYHPGNLLGALCGGSQAAIPTLWLGRSVEGMPTYGSKKLAPPMPVNNGAALLGMFMLYWVLLVFLQMISLLFYALWVVAFFPLWLPLLLLGYFFYETQVLSLQRGQDRWLAWWTGHRQLLTRGRSGMDYFWLRQSITAQVFLQSLPQAYIQYTNNHRRGQWSVLAQVSFFSSVVMVLLYVLYRLAACCNSKLRPERDKQDGGDAGSTKSSGNSPGKRGSLTPPKTPISPNAAKKPLKERVLELCAEYKEPQEQIWLLLLSNQRDLKMVTLLRAYGLTDPAALIKCNDFTLTTLRKVLSASPGADPNDVKLYDKLCVEMQAKYPDGVFTQRMKRFVGYVSGTHQDKALPSPGKPAGDEKKAGGMLSFLTPLLVRQDSKAAALVRQRTLGLVELQDAAAADVDDPAADPTAAAAAPPTQSLTLSDVAAAYQFCWGPVVRVTASTRSNASWIVYGPAEGEAEAPGTMMGRIRLSVSARCAGIVAAVMWAGSKCSAAWTWTRERSAATARSCGTFMMAWATARRQEIEWLGWGTQPDATSPVPDTVLGRVTLSAGLRLQWMQESTATASSALYARVVPPCRQALWYAAVAVAAPFVYVALEVRYIVWGDPSTADPATPPASPTEVSAQTFRGRLSIAFAAAQVWVCEGAVEAMGVLAFAVWWLAKAAASTATASARNVWWIATGEHPTGNAPADSTVQGRLTDAALAAWQATQSACTWLASAAASLLSRAWAAGKEACDAAVVNFRWLVWAEPYEAGQPVVESALERLSISAAARCRNVVWLAGVAAAFVAPAVLGVLWLVFGDQGSDGDQEPEPLSEVVKRHLSSAATWVISMAGACIWGIVKAVVHTYENLMWLVFGDEDSEDDAWERFTASVQARGQRMYEGTVWLDAACRARFSTEPSDTTSTASPEASMGGRLALSLARTREAVFGPTAAAPPSTDETVDPVEAEQGPAGNRSVTASLAGYHTIYPEHDESVHVSDEEDISAKARGSTSESSGAAGFLPPTPPGRFSASESERMSNLLGSQKRHSFTQGSGRRSATYTFGGAEEGHVPEAKVDSDSD